MFWKRIAIILLFIVPSFAFCEEFSYLLEKYLEGDTKTAELKLDLEKARIDLESYNIQKGINLQLDTGSGTMHIDDGETVVEMTPSATVTIPDARNTKLKASVPMRLGGANEDAGAELTLSRDLLPLGRATEEQVQRLDYERKVTTAEWDYTARCNAAEKEFLSKLKELFQLKSDALEKQDDYNEARENFDVALSKGYAKSDTEYQRLELKVRTAEREYNEKMRLLRQGLDQLGRDCNIEIESLPSEIPDMDLIDMKTFSIERYKEYESAIWSKYYNTQKRESTEPVFKLNGSLGYCYGDMGSNDYLDEKNHSVLTGVGMKWHSLSTDLGLKVPVDNLDKTALSFSVTWTPNQSKLDKLQVESDNLSEEQEEIAIRDAIKSYRNTIEDMGTTYKDLDWKQSQYAEEEELYRQIYADYSRYYKSGVVTKLKLDQSATDYETALIASLSCKLDKLIYNMDVINLFIAE